MPDDAVYRELDDDPSNRAAEALKHARIGYLKENPTLGPEHHAALMYQRYYRPTKIADKMMKKHLDQMLRRQLGT